jgi:hypothetical protein
MNGNNNSNSNKNDDNGDSQDIPSTPLRAECVAMDTPQQEALCDATTRMNNSEPQPSYWRINRRTRGRRQENATATSDSPPDTEGSLQRDLGRRENRRQMRSERLPRPMSPMNNNGNNSLVNSSSNDNNNLNNSSSSINHASSDGSCSESEVEPLVALPERSNQAMNQQLSAISGEGLVPTQQQGPRESVSPGYLISPVAQSTPSRSHSHPQVLQNRRVFPTSTGSSSSMGSTSRAGLSRGRLRSSRLRESIRSLLRTNSDLPEVENSEPQPSYWRINRRARGRRQENATATSNPPPAAEGSLQRELGRREKHRQMRSERLPRSMSPMNNNNNSNNSPVNSSSNNNNNDNLNNSSNSINHASSDGTCSDSEVDTLGALPERSNQVMNQRLSAISGEGLVPQQHGPRETASPDYLIPPEAQSTPGAFQQWGRAFGDLPAWCRNHSGRNLQMQQNRRSSSSAGSCPSSFTQRSSISSAGSTSSRFRGSVLSLFRTNSNLPQAELVEAERAVYAVVHEGKEVEPRLCTSVLFFYSLVILLVGMAIGRFTASS